MSPVKHIRKAAWKFSCLACHLANILLALLALALGALLLLNIFQQSVPVPNRIANWIVNRSSTSNLKASWDSIVFDLRGGFHLRGFLLRNADTEQVLITAGETFIEWSPIEFLIPGNPGIQEIDARKVDVYVPVSHSPTGLNEPVITIDHINARQRDGFLILDSLLIQAGGLRLYMHGEASMASLAQTASLTDKHPAATRHNQNAYSLLRQLGRLPPELRADISAEWTLHNDGSHSLKLTAFLPEFTYREVRIERAFGSAQLNVASGSVSLVDLESQGVLSYRGAIPDIPFFNLPDTPVPVPFHVKASGKPIQIEAYSLPSDIHLSLHPVDPEIKFQHLILSSTLSDNLQSPIHYILMGPTAFAEGFASFADTQKPQQLGFPSSYSFRSYLPNWTIYQLLDAPLPDKLLVGTKADSIRFVGSLDVPQRSLRGSLVADGLNIAQTQFDHLSAALTLNPDSILLDTIRVNKSPFEHAAGSYHQHFPSSSFSLNAAGLIFPSSLDAILGDWWTGIFTNIETRNPLPGDVTVWGQWRDLDSLRSVTEVHGSGASYNGVEIPDLELRIRSNRDWAWLDRLRAQFPEGEIAGSIAIQSGLQETDRYRAYRLELASTAPWKAVTGASGLDALKILAFHEANPSLRVSGTMWRDSGKGYEMGHTAELRLSLQQRRGHCMLRTLELSGLSATGTVSGDRVELNGLSGQFADGIFTGHLKIDNWQTDKGAHKQIEIDLINATYGTALEQLTSFVKMASPAATGNINGVPGYLDAELDLSFGETLESYAGTGSISIRDGQLGTVHMFGELSRLLGSMGLGFTSVEMDSLSLDWRLTGPALNIFNGKVTGPALNLTLAGWVDLKTQGLQMKSDLTLFSGVFSKMLTPVSDTFKLSLDGSLEDPEWSIRFNPFGWAINRLNSLEAAPGK